MSTKNLSRTIIEGGRGNGWERKLSHDKHRMTVREYLASLDEEYEPNERFAPRMRVVYKDFRDKTSPIYEWICSQVGRPWNKIYSEIKQRFDVRTTAGRHVVEDHLLTSVNYLGKIENYRRYEDLWVDEHGILRGSRSSTPPVWWKTKYQRNKYPSNEELGRFFGERRATRRGNTFFWLDAQEFRWEGCDNNCTMPGSKHEYRKSVVDSSRNLFHRIPSGRFRQAEAFNRRETEFVEPWWDEALFLRKIYDPFFKD